MVRCAHEGSTLVRPSTMSSVASSLRQLSRMPVSSSFFSARSILIRVSRKLGMPLKTGVAARWRRVCSMPRYSSMRSMLMLSCCSSTSIFSSRVSSRRLKIHGQPKVARPIMTPSTPYVSKARSASASERMSPLPMMGIWMRGLRLTSPMSVQSALPVYIWLRVRPWMVRAWMPQSCNCSASSVMMSCS